MFWTLLVCFRVSLYGLDSSSTFFMNRYRSDEQREMWVVKAVKGAILIYWSNLSLLLMNDFVFILVLSIELLQVSTVLQPHFHYENVQTTKQKIFIYFFTSDWIQEHVLAITHQVNLSRRTLHFTQSSINYHLTVPFGPNSQPKEIKHHFASGGEKK